MLESRSLAGLKEPDEDNVPLQSVDHGKLLDIIDQLRTHGVERHVPLPQLVVCGDQTSGKSSVLEAISNVRFPAKEGVCTRFATEVILRRANEESSAVSIISGEIASEARSSEELDRIQNFSASATFDQIASIIEDAKTAMGLTPKDKTVTDDVLKVEICGPRLPHLTLVDLPGVYHAGPGSETAKKMVSKYMKSKRSIILAIISARSDRELQIVTEMIKEVDPMGKRTFGIITKPDEIKAGMEQDWLDLAQNKVVAYHHGWHILKNRDHKDRDQTTKERDQSEALFFSHKVWSDLPSDVLGIHTLKPRLSTVLKDHIMQELPSLVLDVEREISVCKTTLSNIGQPRKTLKEQQRYLLDAGSRFGYLAQAAVDGNYSHPFFGSAFAGNALDKRLRACVQDIMQRFKTDMHSRGHRYEITEETTERKKNQKQPRKISKSDFLKKVEMLLRNSRGRELSGCYNPLTISDLFFEQARPWSQIAKDCCKSLLSASRSCIALILNEITDESTRGGLLEKVIDPKISELSEELERKVTEILLPHQQGHVITYADQYHLQYRHLLTSMKQDYEKAICEFFSGTRNGNQIGGFWFYMDDLLEKLKIVDEERLQEYTCMEIVEHMKGYYEIAMKRFIDSFASQGFENTILSKLPNILSPSVIMELDDNLIHYIAGENESSKSTRKYVCAKLRSLEGGQAALGSLAQNQLGDFSRSISSTDESSFVEVLGDVDTSDSEADNDSSSILDDTTNDSDRPPKSSENTEPFVIPPRPKSGKKTIKELDEDVAMQHEPICEPEPIKEAEVADDDFRGLWDNTKKKTKKEKQKKEALVDFGEKIRL